MKQKLLTLFVVVLYSLTGSAAAYAAAGECELNSPAGPVMHMMAMDGMDCPAMDNQNAKHDGAIKCWVMCHLLVATVATLPDFTISTAPVRRAALHHDVQGMPTTHKVPTPPPDFV